MKRVLLIVVAIIGFYGFVFGQTVGVQVIGGTTENTEKKDDCAYRISGICTTEDLGGVETTIRQETDYDNPISLGYYQIYSCVDFENYNDFTVNIIYETSYFDTKESKRTGTLVLKPNEKKTVKSKYEITVVRLIARKLSK